jgi:spermidine synthase
MSPNTEARAGIGMLAGVGTVSAATLAVEILQTRLFSVMLWHHLTYMVVTVTLLGFAASGSLLAILPRSSRLLGEPRAAVSLCCSLFGLTLIAAFAILGRSDLDTLDIERDRIKYFYLFLEYAYLLVPFVFAGLAIAIALQEYAASVHRTYFWNLLGSGIGPFLFLIAIRPLGGLGTLLMCASAGGLAAWMAAPPRGTRSRAVCRALALLTVLIWPLGTAFPTIADRCLPIEPARSKAQTVSERFYDYQEEQLRAADPTYPARDEHLRQTRWGPVCRLDTLPVPRSPQDVARDRTDPAGPPRGQVHVFQDGDAPTVIWSGSYAADHPYETNFYGLGYHVATPSPRVVIIGPGGGNDIETALHYGARSVTAVDINGDTLAMLRSEPFASYTNFVYDRAGVRAVHSEGRSFLRREGEQYDLLQMSGTDTYAALSSGSYIFSESYLYTEEAFDDFFAHMSERGVISIIRFRFEPPREELKLVATGARALRRLGVTDPRQHFMVVNQESRAPETFAREIERMPKGSEALERLRAVIGNIKQPLRYAAILMRRTPFTTDEVAQVERAVEPMTGPETSHTVYYGAGLRGEDNEYSKLLTAMAAGPESEAAFQESYPYQIAPATDDQPFFFNFYSLADVKLGGASEGGYDALTGSEPIGLYVLVALVIQTGIATLLLVILPLLRLGWRAGTISRTRALAYFMALGLAYLLVEITTVQRFVLYLGHPTYSLSAGLACFMVASGLGSAVAGRLGAGPRAAVAAALVVVALLIAHALLLPWMLRATLSYPEWQRVALTVAAIAPLAFAMGIPFPTGLRLLRDEPPGWIPWAFGVNGAASVLASILSIVVAMQAGFTTVFALAAALYLLAAFTVPRGSTAAA